MINLSSTTPADLEQIRKWWNSDADHSQKPLSDEFFLTGTGLLCFRLDDSTGPTMYVRCEQDARERVVRMHIQFGEQSVSRSRIAKAIFKTLPVVIQYFKDSGFIAMAFDSVAPDLISFLKRFDFKPVEGTNDFELDFYPMPSEAPTVVN